MVGAESKMFYADGNLYLFSFLGSDNSVTKSSGYPLWKVAADGSSKEVALTVREFPRRYTIFEDMVYYEFQTEKEDGKIVSRVLCQPLEGGEEIQIWESSLQDGGLTVLQGIGDKVYFFENGLAQSIDMKDPEFDINEVESCSNMYTYEPKTKTLIMNPEFGEKEGNQVFIRNVYDGMMYYAYYDKSKKIENELWCRPVGGGEEQCLGNMPQYTNIADSEYVYTFCLMEEDPMNNMVRAYDYKGNQVQEVQIPKEGDLTWIPATEEYIFGFFRGQTSEGGRKWDTALVVFERSKLKEGKAEMIRIFENEWS